MSASEARAVLGVLRTLSPWLLRVIAADPHRVATLAAAEAERRRTQQEATR